MHFIDFIWLLILHIVYLISICKNLRNLNHNENFSNPLFCPPI